MHDNNVSSVLKHLRNALGSNKVLTDPDLLEKYSHDETSDLSFMPDMAVRALSAEDVSLVLRICNEYHMPVIPRGGGTSVTGGSVPVDGGVVLSLELMNNIIEIDTQNMVAVTEPGVITAELQKAALEEGLMYPPDPASLDSCSIGGNVAVGAGGAKAVKYGTTKDYILGLQFVLPDGSIINRGGKYVKDATGYNLIGLLTGSEGTLAVITKIFVKLIPAPGHVVDILIPYDSIDSAVKDVLKIINSKIIPSTLEFMEADAIRLVSQFLNSEMPFADANAHLLIQLDGYSPDAVNHDLEKLIDCLGERHEKAFVAETTKQSERLWKARRSIRDAIKQESPVFLGEDTVVPRSYIPQFINELKEYFKSLNLRSIMFGHAGDGNVHVDVLKGSLDYNEWKKMLPELKKMIYCIALNYCGNITGEHGIGFIKKDYLPLALSKPEIELIKRIKHAFDPHNILNPKKII